MRTLGNKAKVGAREKPRALLHQVARKDSIISDLLNVYLLPVSALSFSTSYCSFFRYSNSSLFHLP